VDTGNVAFLQQAHRNNWQQYLASLKPGSRVGFDVCVLTASDERQAIIYCRQLAWRREAGLLPARTHFLVIPDPAGRRIGSGGATLYALEQVAEWDAEATDPKVFPKPFGSVLMIHSGGDSKRLPHCSAIGKLFARVPRTLPDGRASTIFDEFLISLSALSAGLPPGVLISSGDVLLIFDHLQLSFRRPGAIGVAAAAPAEMGRRHGVYVSGDGGYRVRAYLHKPSAEELARWEAVSPDGTVQIDTGLVWLDAATATRWLALAHEATVAALCGPQSTIGLNLYGDLLLPLAGSTTFEGYLADESDGPATPAVQTARRVIWERLRGTPFSVERLQPAVFVHFGSTAEYWRMAADDGELARLCGWEEAGAEERGSKGAGEWLVLINAAIGSAPGPMKNDPSSEQMLMPGAAPVRSLPVGRPLKKRPGFEALAGLVVNGRNRLKPLVRKRGRLFSEQGQKWALVTDSLLRGPFVWEGAALVVAVQTAQPLALGSDVVIHQLPIAGGGYVTRIFGLCDDPKQLWDAAKGGTFLNLPWAAWLKHAGLTAEQVWPDVPAGERTLWNARLYPLVADREASLSLALPLQSPEQADPGWRSRWLMAERLSLGESFLRADGERLMAELSAVEDEVTARRFYAAFEAEQPAAEAARWLAASPYKAAQRAGLVGSWLDGADPILRLRGYKAVAEATGDATWEDRAFAVLATMIEAVTNPGAVIARSQVGDEAISYSEQNRTTTRRARVFAAARIDFGGGWTDTPPYSIERGGTVLNAAITLKGAYPIVADVEPLSGPRLILESRDIGTVIEPACAGEVLAYANPADPFALHKAALVLRGIVPADADPAAPLSELFRHRGGGLRLTTETNIPRGSGLGTSSIMAGAVLAALHSYTPAQLFDEVLCLEQMLTTGGGWQDQVGGLIGGIKLITTQPGLPQRIQVEPVLLPPQAAAEFRDRLLLVYTGQQRLAKNLLRAVMGRWMARDPEMVWLQAEIARLAIAMRDALKAGDLDTFGALLGEHWLLNKRMDLGCTNPFIDGLFEAMRSYINGGKLAGAGGGGYAIVVARSREAAKDMAAALSARYAGTAVGVWESAVPGKGLLVG
jgi:galactokinase/mevalonate kinase-like predicted kinase